MQFASKMMLVPFNKEALQKCINTRTESEIILNNSKLDTTDKLVKYRHSIGVERRKNEKNKATKVALKETYSKAPEITETSPQQSEKVSDPPVAPAAIEVDALQQLKQQLDQQKQNNIKLQQEHRRQLRLEKAKIQKLQELESKVRLSTESASGLTKKRKIVYLPPAEQAPYPFTVTVKPPDLPKKLLTQALVQKLDVMPEEADKDPTIPSLGRYDRQFVEPNKRPTRSLLNWKKF